MGVIMCALTGCAIYALVPFMAVLIRWGIEKLAGE